jgi:hypothetical protein
MNNKPVWVNMILEVVDKSGLFKWVIKEVDESAVSVLYSDWDEDSKEWKPPSSDLTIYDTNSVREVAARMIQLCDHIDEQDGKGTKGDKEQRIADVLKAWAVYIPGGDPGLHQKLAAAIEALRGDG